MTFNVTYAGAPQFVTITNTIVQYAVNTPEPGVPGRAASTTAAPGRRGFSGASASGPWSFCTSVPSAIYTIPPSNPNYNVTYVVVQSSTPTTVVYSQTSGYSGEYVAATGVLMFGAGMLVGAAIANNNHDHYYYPPSPATTPTVAVRRTTTGTAATTAPRTWPTDPTAARAGRPATTLSTGTYARSSYAYGPYGSASRSAAYNPYTGTSAAGRTVSTPYGTARQGAAYNPYTGARAAGGSVNTAYGSAEPRRGLQPDDRQCRRGAAPAPAPTAAPARCARAKARRGLMGHRKQPGRGRQDPVGRCVRREGRHRLQEGLERQLVSKLGQWLGERHTPNRHASAVRASRQPQATAYQRPLSMRSTAAVPPQLHRQAQTGTYQQPRSTAASTSTSASSSWSQNKQSLESQAQARQSGNQQSQRASQYQSLQFAIVRRKRRSSGGGSSRGGGGERVVGDQ